MHMYNMYDYICLQLLLVDSTDEAEDADSLADRMMDGGDEGFDMTKVVLGHNISMPFSSVIKQGHCDVMSYNTRQHT